MALMSESQDKKRKKNAKRVAVISGTGFSVSALFYIFGDPQLGIFLAVVFSAIPSLVNLVDD